MALFTKAGTRVLGADTSNFHVAAAVEVPRVGRTVVGIVYVPPARQGHLRLKYGDIWQDIMESIRTLQMAHNIVLHNFMILGDMNAHVGTEPMGTPTEQVLTGHRLQNHRGFQILATRHSRCMVPRDPRGEAMSRQMRKWDSMVLNGRCEGDVRGTPTFVWDGGAKGSVIDYAVVHNTASANM